MAQQRFCTRCGAPAGADAGSGVPADGDSPEVTQTVQPPQQAQTAQPAEVTQCLQQPQEAQQPQAVPMASPIPSPQPASPRPPHDRRQAVVIAVCVVVIVAALAVFLAVLHPWAPAASTASTSVATTSVATSSVPATTAAVTTSVASTAAASTAAASTTVQTQDSYYSQLSSAYSQLGSLDSEISSAAAEFNQDYLSSDTSLRSSDAKTVSGLLGDSSTLLSSLRAMNVPTSSKNYATWQNLITLANDCVQRSTVINESWQRSLSISSPSESDSDYICAPLARDNDSSSHNTYKIEFDDLYPSAKPVQ